MTTIYAVSYGEYSGYAIQAMYVERADAEAHLARIPGGDIEEWELRPKGDRKFRRHQNFAASIEVDSNGVMLDETFGQWAFQTEGDELDNRLPSIFEPNCFGRTRIVAYSSKSAEHARKAVRERAAKYVSEKL